MHPRVQLQMLEKALDVGKEIFPLTTIRSFGLRLALYQKDETNPDSRGIGNHGNHRPGAGMSTVLDRGSGWLQVGVAGR
jgi:hypothetical protein